MVYAQLLHAIAQGLAVAKVAGSYAVDAHQNTGSGLFVGQACHLIGIGLAAIAVLVGNGFNHRSVHYALHA